jgi:hypothetical protein
MESTSRERLGSPAPGSPLPNPALPLSTANVVVRRAELTTTSPALDVRPNCQAGEVATGGGFAALGLVNGISSVVSSPTSGGSDTVDGSVADGYRVTFLNPNGNDTNFVGYVICASP